MFRTVALELFKVLNKSESFESSVQYLNQSTKMLKNLRPLMIDANGTRELVQVFRRGIVEIQIYLPQNQTNVVKTYHDFQSHVENVSGKKEATLQPNDWVKCFLKLTT